MKSKRVFQSACRNASGKCLQAVQVAALGLLLAATLPLFAQEPKDSDVLGPGKGNEGVGFIASKSASAKEVGLPLYPGARPHPDKADDSPAIQLGLWGGGWGFKLVVLKLESNDPPEKIATFYQKALAKYGRVWNCSDSTKAEGKRENTSSPNELNCQDEQPASGETVLKAGSKVKKHIVAIKPEGGASVFQLVYIEAPESDRN